MSTKRSVAGLHHGSRAAKLVDNRGHELPEAANDFIQSISIERTIDVGSTLTLTARDPNHYLVHQGYFTRRPDDPKERPKRADLFMPDPEGGGGLWFRASNFEKIAVDEFKLEFEDREIAIAREYIKPQFKMLAGNLPNPRAIFIKKLILKAVPHVHFVCPELEKATPVVIQHARKKGEKLHRGLKGKKVSTIEGVPLDPEQLHNAETILAVCDELKAPAGCYLGILCAGIQESKLHHNERTGNHIGVFQANVGHYNPADVAKEARAWLQGGTDFQGGGGMAYVRAHPGVAPGVLAQAVEASGIQEIHNYEKHKADAEAILQAYGGARSAHSGSGASSAPTSGHTERSSFTEQRSFEFPKSKQQEGGEPESAWECGEAYAKELNWRLYCSVGQIFFVSDEHLEKSEVAMEIDEGDPGIVDLKWGVDYNSRKNPPRLEVEVRINPKHPWMAGPGMPVVVGKKQGKEIHEGLWIVHSIHRPDYTDNAATITLERPKKPIAEHLQEPQPKTPEGVAHFQIPGGEKMPEGINPGPAGGAEQIALKVWEQVKWIGQQHYRYVYGGGHGSHFGPTDIVGNSHPPAGIPAGLDCSGALSWALGTAGLMHAFGDGPTDTHGLEHWGAGGRGKYFTIWVENSASHEHCYMDIYLPTSIASDAIRKVFEASHTGATEPWPHGVGLRDPYRNSASGLLLQEEGKGIPGFVARHWPGA